MASFQPFEPAIKSGVLGQTQNISVNNSSQNIVIDSTGTENTTLLVTVDGPQGSVTYMRMSVEASTAITATTTDTPMPGAQNPTIRLFANPSPSGKTSIAVITTVLVSISAINFWITPGQGGIA